MSEEELKHVSSNHSDLELKTQFGSFRARGYDGMMMLLVVGAFSICGGMFYLTTVLTAQLVALEHAQRMTLCVLALPDDQRWAQITSRDSVCSMLAKYPSDK